MRYAILTALFLAACVTPRTSTEEERAWAQATISKLTIAITALQATGNIEPEKAALALEQLQELREMVEQSATSSVSWSGIVDRLITIGLQWAIPLPPK